jgi:regulator of cell morphogenesis and NO signaling
MQITPNMKMAEVIHLNYQLLQILSRFGIQLGFGDRSIRQVCRENNIDVNFFIEIINSYHDKNYFPKKNLQGFPLKLIIEYLRESHNYYLEIKIPQIEQLISQLSGFSDRINGESLKMIDTFFHGYIKELQDHIQREEEKVYPYVFSVEEAFHLKKIPDNLVRSLREYSIDDFESEHDNIEDKLFDLKNIIIKYLPLPVDPTLCNAILTELFRLEADLNDHARIEDKVLVPKVRFMEKWINEHYAQ